MTHAKPSDPGFYAWLLKQAVRFAILIEFLVNLYVFPFFVELAVAPLILALVMAQVVAASDGSLDAARKPADWMLGPVGVLLLVHAVVEGMRDPSGLLARETWGLCLSLRR